MPFYFAYGANMDVAAMAQRCPASSATGVAQLPHHRLFITSDGYASVERSMRDRVHGVLWNLALADVRALDRFEGLDRCLYRKAFAPVILGRGRSVRAMIYLGSARGDGAPRAGYVETILEAARKWELPSAYCVTIAALGAAKTGVRPGPAFENFAPRA